MALTKAQKEAQERYKKKDPERKRRQTRENWARHRQPYAERGRRNRAERKILVLAKYGPEGKIQCSWPACEVIDPDMLTIDHIGNDGYLSRKSVKSGAPFHQWLETNDFPPGYQTLCWNHQWKKEIMRRKEARR